MNATAMKPTSIISLADRVLARNRQRNRNETRVKIEGNFEVQQKDRKFHSNNELDNGGCLPKFCQADCPGLESLTLPGEGSVLGCVDPLDQRHWRRLDRLTSCPARKPRPALPLPDFCHTDCEHYSKTVLPNSQIMRKCWSSKLGRGSGLLHLMSDCPGKKGQDKR